MTTKITVEQSERGWDVRQENTASGSVYPTTSYPNAAKAAARVMQLMELTAPVTPQNWPEDICIGFIETDDTKGGA